LTLPRLLLITLGEPIQDIPAPAEWLAVDRHPSRKAIRLRVPFADPLARRRMGATSGVGRPITADMSG
jgi:hypothetical protein